MTGLRGRAHMDLFIHTPTYDGTVAMAYVHGLLDTLAGLGCSYAIGSGTGPLVARNRDEITTQFAETNCTHMLCIDADVRFERRDVELLIAADRGCVAGCYPSKDRKRRVMALPIKDGRREGDLVACEFVPAGFMLVTRDVIHAVAEPYLESGCYLHQGQPTLPIWQSDDGTRCGEDVAFCRKVRAAGHDVWLHTKVRLGHYGAHMYEFPDGALTFLG